MATTPPRVSLDQIHVANPCPADFAAMSGDAQRRFCAHCQKHVHNLSEMTRDAAEALICSSAGQLCVRYEADAAGRVMTLDYAPTKSISRVRRWAPIAAIFTAFSSAAVAMALRHQPVATPPRMMIMGDIACPLPVTTQPTTQPATQPTTAPTP